MPHKCLEMSIDGEKLSPFRLYLDDNGCGHTKIKGFTFDVILEGDVIYLKADPLNQKKKKVDFHTYEFKGSLDKGEGWKGVWKKTFGSEGDWGTREGKWTAHEIDCTDKIK
ncbi:MAG: hypothetical protein M1521_02980 [Thermotogae bacterium]|nr:hypothetical protein [Thermotogota bacterium]